MKMRQAEKELSGLARGLGSVAGVAANRRGVLADRQGFAEEIALHHVAAFVGEEAELLLGFHALGDDRHLQAMAEPDDGPDDRGRLRVAAEIDDEGAVDLDLVERESLQIGERRIAAAEIVHGNAYAERLQP